MDGCAAKDVMKPDEEQLEVVEETEPVDCSKQAPLSAPTIVGGTTQETDRISFGVRASFRSNLVTRMVVERDNLSEGSVPVPGGGVRACFAIDLPENQSSQIVVYGQDKDSCDTEKTTFTVTHKSPSNDTDTSITAIPEPSGRNIAGIAEVTIANGKRISGSIESLSNPVGNDEVTMRVSDWPGVRNDVKIFYNFNHVDVKGVVQNALDTASQILIGTDDLPTHHVDKVRVHWKTQPLAGTDIKIYVNEEIKKPDVVVARSPEWLGGFPVNPSVPASWIVAGHVDSIDSEALFIDIPLDGNANAIRHLFVSLGRTAGGSFHDTFSLTEIELLSPSKVRPSGTMTSGCFR